MRERGPGGGLFDRLGGWKQPTELRNRYLYLEARMHVPRADVIAVESDRSLCYRQAQPDSICVVRDRAKEWAGRCLRVPLPVPQIQSRGRVVTTHSFWLAADSVGRFPSGE